jgi:hypothetical protein
LSLILFGSIVNTKEGTFIFKKAIKDLDLDYLKSLGIADCQFKGLPAVKIPYLDEYGHDAATRFRLF